MHDIFTFHVHVRYRVGRCDILTQFLVEAVALHAARLNLIETLRYE